MRSCQSDAETNFSKEFSKNKFGVRYSYGTEELNKIAAYPYEFTVKKCWWKNLEFNCSDAFYNHMSDTMFSFTFNVGNIMSKQQEEHQFPG